MAPPSPLLFTLQGVKYWGPASPTHKLPPGFAGNKGGEGWGRQTLRAGGPEPAGEAVGRGAPGTRARAGRPEPPGAPQS